jgi:uncharacterized damage-inducible protein DinB
MELSGMLLAEFDEENDKTRKVLARLPDDRMDWQPHDKSMSMGRLATHLARLPGKCGQLITENSLDIAPDRQPPVLPAARTRAEVLDLFTAGILQNRPLVAALDDAALAAPWTLMRDGCAIYLTPRIVALRQMFFSHTVHHRGQLTVYLRMNDVALPALFGPSADEDN